MSTNGVIAKRDGGSWVGVYHHWDSYPSGLGVALLRAYKEAFSCDVDAMTTYLVDDEPVGWSTICNADWSQPKGWRDRFAHDAPCATCDHPMWEHYAQYYPEGGPGDPMVNGMRRQGLREPDTTMQLGHSHEDLDTPQGPQSYSARGEQPNNGVADRIVPGGDTMGAAYLYVLLPEGILVSDFYGEASTRPATLIRWDDTKGMTALDED